MNELESWLTCMRRGDFAAAWELSDASLAARKDAECRHLPRHEQWVWRGEPLHAQRVLIRCYHGLGDTIQFIRYAPLVREIASEVNVWLQPALMPLLHAMPGIDRLLPLHDGAPELEYDADVEVMELAHVFRSTLDSLPCAVPYLDAAPLDLPRDHRMRIGVAWRAGDWDAQRSIPFAVIRRLAAVHGVTLYALQLDLTPDEQYGPFLALPEREDLFSTARVMRALDLVITVDSMPAHLAGALGVPVWTLLPHDCDWRWMDERADSPWYPTMRLFRQPAPGAWEPVIAEVVAALRMRTRAPRGIRVEVGEVQASG